MKVIYFDHAATSWPKPDGVREALSAYFGEAGGNPGRSGHRMSIAAARVVEDARDAVARLFGASDPSRVSFTQNATHALNIAIYGVLKPGDRVVTTSVEHNSVMRPLRHVETLGVSLDVVSSEPDGSLDLENLRKALKVGARLLVTTHASNVAGAILPTAEIAAIAHEYGVLCLVDAAQTAGALPIAVEASDIDLLAFTGHKSLLGPTGTGGLYIREGLHVEPLLRGGTGSDSAHETQPTFAPDAHESGTLNVAGLAGLAEGVRFIQRVGVDAIRKHEQELTTRFLTGASGIAGLYTYGPASVSARCGVVSFNIDGAVSSEIGQILDDSFGILCRTGLHCAPLAHRTMGTFPTGTVRFSFGYSNTLEEIDVALNALREIAAWAASGKQAGAAWTV
ncbi:MAG: aminotransferase class V-fold PLP-dependent enzyme [Bryobacteraceae bacterium]